MESTASNKRRKPSPDLVHFTVLPDTILAFVGSFLPKPSQAMFAMATTAPPSSWKPYSLQRQLSATSKAILSLTPTQEWSSLDFEDIDKDLAAKLTDDDVGAILVCIDAANRLERLKLTGLLNINGAGLEPLRGSAVLEQVDLSLLRLNEKPSSLTSLISQEVALPILDSIVNKDGNKLKHLFLPQKWCDGNDDNPELLGQFLTRFDNLLYSRPFDCKGCCENPEACPGVGGQVWIHPYSSQNFTCYACLNNFCYDTGCDGAVKCKQCEKSFCSNCDPHEGCGVCGDVYCKSCSCIALAQCDHDCCEDDGFCGSCLYSCDCCSKKECHSDFSIISECEGRLCKKRNCRDCEDSENVHFCYMCKKSYCFDCLCSVYQDCIATESKSNFCSKCAIHVVSKLREDKEKLRPTE